MKHLEREEIIKKKKTIFTILDSTQTETNFVEVNQKQEWTLAKSEEQSVKLFTLRKQKEGMEENLGQTKHRDGSADNSNINDGNSNFYDNSSFKNDHNSLHIMIILASDTMVIFIFFGLKDDDNRLVIFMII